MNSKIIIRIDDVCETMDWDRFFYSAWPGIGSVEDGIVGSTPGGVSVYGSAPLDVTYLLTAAFDHQVTDGSTVYFDGEVVRQFSDVSDLSNQTIDLL